MAIESRFIVTNEHGYLMSSSTRGKALSLAHTWFHDGGLWAEISDTMAHFDYPDLYEVTRLGGIRTAHYRTVERSTNP